MGNLDLWYSRIHVDEMAEEFMAEATAAQKKRLEKNLAKARSKDSLAAFSKLTETVDGETRIKGDPPLIVRSTTSFPTAGRGGGHESFRVCSCATIAGRSRATAAS